MPQRLDNLRAKVAELQTELARVDSLDPAARAELEATIAEIQAALDQDDAPAEHHTLAEQLTSATEQFEKDYPTLTRILGSVADALSQLGI